MAELVNGKVVVKKDFDAIAEQGFGEKQGKTLVLAPFEALYLVEKKKIEVGKGKKQIEFPELIKEFKKKNKMLESVYSVFKDLRVAGYVARDGKCDAPCFRVYARGARPEEEPSRYLLWILDPKKSISAKQLREMVERSHAVRKRALFSFVEQGTITYFKIDTSKF
jgi:tRNA-intron lyase